MPLIVNRTDWNEIMSERKILSSDAPRPVRWVSLLDKVAEGRIVQAGLSTLVRSGVYISWHLWKSTILAAVFRRPLVYLCWGVDYHTGLRRYIARLVLRRARVVLVNDARTAAEVRRIAAGVEPRQVPYLVDVEFFKPPRAEEREDFLFCPGTNDRDGEILLALARRGHRIKWLNNSPEITARYAGREARLVLISFPTFDELRGLYQRCRAVVTPLTRDIHAAGQTTTLEGLASGCPVVISQGRTAEMFAPDRLVTVVDDSDPLRWEEAVDRAISADAANPSAAHARASIIAKRHGVPAVSAAMHEVLQLVAEEYN